MRNAVISVCLLLIGATVQAGPANEVRSPDGKLVFSISLQHNRPVYSVSFNGRQLIGNSFLRLAMNDDYPLDNCTLARPPEIAAATASYRLFAGKTAAVKERYNRLVIFLTGKKYAINIEVRVFNDGLAFRYVFPKQKNKTAFNPWIGDSYPVFVLIGGVGPILIYQW